MAGDRLKQEIGLKKPSCECWMLKRALFSSGFHSCACRNFWTSPASGTEVGSNTQRHTSQSLVLAALGFFVFHPLSVHFVCIRAQCMSQLASKCDRRDLDNWGISIANLANSSWRVENIPCCLFPPEGVSQTSLWLK